MDSKFIFVVRDYETTILLEIKDTIKHFYRVLYIKPFAYIFCILFYLVFVLVS